MNIFWSEAVWVRHLWWWQRMQLVFAFVNMCINIWKCCHPRTDVATMLLPHRCCHNIVATMLLPQCVATPLLPQCFCYTDVAIPLLPHLLPQRWCHNFVAAPLLPHHWCVIFAAWQLHRNRCIVIVVYLHVISFTSSFHHCNIMDIARHCRHGVIISSLQHCRHSRLGVINLSSQLCCVIINIASSSYNSEYLSLYTTFGYKYIILTSTTLRCRHHVLSNVLVDYHLVVFFSCFFSDILLIIL